MTRQGSRSREISTPVLSRQMRYVLAVSSVTLFALMLLSVYLSPFAYMVVTAFKNRAQITDPNEPILPLSATYTYTGEEITYEFTFADKDQEVKLQPGDEFDLYEVEAGGETHQWALVVPRRGTSFFVDPGHPGAGLIEWQGEWRTLQPTYRLDLQLGNFARAWSELDFLQKIRNTLVIAICGDIGTLVSCVLVAYGFSRFRIPGKGILLIVLTGTIILPGQVTLIPTYALYSKIGWIGTFLPLIVPHFFANAYNVFLLRQYFMSIPKDVDEAAMLDGAGPLRTLISVILPQAIPVLVAVALFHFVFAWNDYFAPLIYLASVPNLQPISVAIQFYNQAYTFEPYMIQATAIMGLALPVILFFIGQRAFMQGVVAPSVGK
jgi:multiple sugar transport system permease protein